MSKRYGLLLQRLQDADVRVQFRAASELVVYLECERRRPEMDEQICATPSASNEE